MTRALHSLDDRPSQPLLDAGIDTERLAHVGLRNFFGIVDEWSLSNDQARVVIGSPGRATYFRWKRLKAKSLSRDTLDRISLVMGIYKATHILFPLPERANEWIRRPNSAFGGKTPLEIMLTGGLDSLFSIRRHLDAARG